MQKLSRLLVPIVLSCLLTSSGCASHAPAPTMPTSPIELVTLDPGHFHAALIQRDAYPGVSDRAHVYAPLGRDLVDHLGRVARFNARADNPTHWQLEVHSGPDFLERLTRERPGNVAVISGRNRGKLGYVEAVVDAGLNALVDKPWVLQSSDLERLSRVLDRADERHLIAFDIMTERFEITNVLQRELVADRELFGELEQGTPELPGVYMESVHHLMKQVAGAVNVRPAWFFDPEQQGEGLDDIGTHLVDLVQWTLFPEQALDYRRDVEVLAAQRWATHVTRSEFEQVTLERDFPPSLARNVKGGVLEAFMNTLVNYRLRGVHVRLDVRWNWEAPEGGGDTQFAVYRGSRARVEVRQGASESWRTALYVVPVDAAHEPEVRAALERRITLLSARYPGIALRAHGAELEVTIDAALRTSHEQHFGEVARQFFRYIDGSCPLPAWEKPNMLAKYWVTTRGAELSRSGPARAAERLVFP
jgi:predicted dehydrogenase